MGYFLTMWIRSTFGVPSEMMAIEMPQNDEISGGGKNECGEELDSAIHQRRANRGSINVKERERG